MEEFSSPWHNRWINSDSSQEEEMPLEELSGIKGFTDLEDDVFLHGTDNDDWMLPLSVHVDRQQQQQYDADDEEVAAITRPPLATLALAMPPPASPSSPIDIPRRERQHPPRLTIPPRDFSDIRNYYSAITPSPPQLDGPLWPKSRRPIYSPITPSPPRIASPMPSMLAGPPAQRPIYSPITPPLPLPVAVVPPVMMSTTLPTPTLTKVVTVLGRMSPTMAQILDNGM